MKIAVILVHYYTPELARGACEALMRDADTSGIGLEAVLVDNGSRPEDRALLESLPARRIDAGRNLGYAGGANLGIRETSADLVIVMNPDVMVLDGCLRALTEVLESGAAAVGPRFYWDHQKRFQLPPTEPVSRRSELLSVLARRSPLWAGFARRRWRRHARSHWLAETPLRSYDLSGALLAFRRSAWQQIGPFDERYRLYFEETDWLQRLRAHRLKACWVPQAEAVHLYAQSTVGEGRAQAWFSESSRRFRRKAYGPTFTSLLERLSQSSPLLTDPVPDPLPETATPPAWLEVSPSPLGFPAAARRPPHDTPPHNAPPRGASRKDLPAEIESRLAAGTYYLRWVDEAGRELGTSVLEKA